MTFSHRADQLIVNYMDYFHKKYECLNFLMPNSLHSSYGAKYLRIDQVKFFKGYLPQISLGPFLNTWTHM